jgi:hypothetical protein
MHYISLPLSLAALSYFKKLPNASSTCKHNILSHREVTDNLTMHIVMNSILCVCFRIYTHTYEME